MQLTVSEVWYVHKYHEYQEYGGPEEGGWYYDVREPVRDDEWTPPIFTDEEEAFAKCRELYAEEYARRKEEEPYEYTSVLSHRCTFYAFDCTTESMPYSSPTVRPHYE